jgi:hypothetical protein
VYSLWCGSVLGTTYAASPARRISARSALILLLIDTAPLSSPARDDRATVSPPLAGFNQARSAGFHHGGRAAPRGLPLVADPPASLSMTMRFSTSRTRPPTAGTRWSPTPLLRSARRHGSARQEHGRPPRAPVGRRAGPASSPGGVTPPAGSRWSPTPPAALSMTTRPCSTQAGVANIVSGRGRSPPCMGQGLSPWPRGHGRRRRSGGGRGRSRAGRSGGRSRWPRCS